VEGGAQVTVTDASGTTTAMLHDAVIAKGSVTGDKLAVPYWDWVTDEDGDQRLAIVTNE
jgi:hypothetical protein